MVLSMLLMFGLIKAMADDAIQGNLNNIALAANYKDRWLIIVGDGLSQMRRLRAFKELLEILSYSFETLYERAQIN